MMAVSIGFFSRPLLSYPIRLNLPPGGCGRRSPTVGRRCVLVSEIAKTSLRDVSLACLIGESYDFAVYPVVKGVFSGGIGLEIRFGVSEVHS